jgi:hypothetical protein
MRREHLGASVAITSYAFVAFDRTIWSSVITSGSVIGVELRVAAQPEPSSTVMPNVKTLRHCIAFISGSKGRRREIRRPARPPRRADA